MLTKPTHMRLREDTLRQLDDLRRAESDLPNKTEMVRRLVERASKALKTKRKDD